MPAFPQIIARKRDGHRLSVADIQEFVGQYTTGQIPDYQAAALLMAIVLRGMDSDETAALTTAMADSGVCLNLGDLAAPTLDKHSTGGVGDKTSLVVVPLLAAAGVAVCKMSGRGLGHTGGTLDKLESIPGFRVALSADDMLAQVARIGACIAGQTETLAPADRKIYALRDATATVESLPLIVSSILSKKIAGGASAFLFDVKVGDGALMRTLPEARALAEALVCGAGAHGRRAVALLTDMNQPLGSSIGNSLEVAEAILLLTPGAPHDSRFRRLCLHLTAEGLLLAGKSDVFATAFSQAETLLDTGAAREKFREIVAAQRGDAAVVDDPQKLPRAPVMVPVPADFGGFVARVQTADLGRIVMELGGGRSTKDARINPAVGLVLQKSVGDRVASGETLAVIHADSQQDAAAVRTRVQAAFIGQADVIGDAPPLIAGRVAGNEFSLGER